MKLSKAQFIKDLGTKLGSVYSFFAEESIQISELTDEVIKKAKTAGFEDKQTYIVTKDTDWSFLSSENENFDLFLKFLKFFLLKLYLILLFFLLY